MTTTERTMENANYVNENEIKPLAETETAHEEVNFLDRWYFLLPLSVVNSFLAIQALNLNNIYGTIPTGLLVILLVTGGFTAYLYHRSRCLLTAIVSCIHIGTTIGKIFGAIFCLIPGIGILIAFGVTIGFTLIMTGFVLGCAYALPIVFLPLLRRIIAAESQ